MVKLLTAQEFSCPIDGIRKEILKNGIFEERIDSLGSVKPFFDSLPGYLAVPKVGIKVSYSGGNTITATQMINKSGGTPFKSIEEAFGLAGLLLKNKKTGVIVFLAHGESKIFIIRASGRISLPEPQVYVEELITIDNPEGIMFKEGAFYFSGPLIKEREVVFEKQNSDEVENLN